MSNTAFADNVANNLFDDVSGADAGAGDIEYRCFYVRNGHATLPWLAPKIWLSTLTTSADTEFDIGLATEGVSAAAAAIANEGTAPAGVTFSRPTTKGAGLDSTLGLAFAHAGWMYPFFGAMLGWLGVALTGSDTSSNVLFGGLQRVSAEQLGLSPVLMAAANSSGGVMGKMIDAQSIVVASTATQWYGHEGEILRYVFFHSLALAALMGVLIMAQAYVYPFTMLVVR